MCFATHVCKGWKRVCEMGSNSVSKHKREDHKAGSPVADAGTRQPSSNSAPSLSSFPTDTPHPPFGLLYHNVIKASQWLVRATVKRERQIIGMSSLETALDTRMYPYVHVLMALGVWKTSARTHLITLRLPGRTPSCQLPNYILLQPAFTEISSARTEIKLSATCLERQRRVPLVIRNTAIIRRPNSQLQLKRATIAHGVYPHANGSGLSSTSASLTV